MTNSVPPPEQVENSTISCKGTDSIFTYGLSEEPEKYFQRVLFLNTVLTLAVFLYISVRLSFAGKTFEDFVPFLNFSLPILYLILGLSYLPFFWPGFGKTGRIKVYSEDKPVIETRIRIVTRRNLFLQRRGRYLVGTKDVTSEIQKIARNAGNIDPDKVRFYRELFGSECCLTAEEFCRLPVFIWGITQ